MFAWYIQLCLLIIPILVCSRFIQFIYLCVPDLSSLFSCVFQIYPVYLPVSSRFIQFIYLSVPDLSSLFTYLCQIYPVYLPICARFIHFIYLSVPDLSCFFTSHFCFVLNLPFMGSIKIFQHPIILTDHQWDHNVSLVMYIANIKDQSFLWGHWQGYHNTSVGYTAYVLGHHVYHQWYHNISLVIVAYVLGPIFPVGWQSNHNISLILVGLCTRTHNSCRLAVEL